MNTNYKKVPNPYIEKWQVRVSTTFSIALSIAFCAGLAYMGFLALDWLGHYIMEALTFVRP